MKISSVLKGIAGGLFVLSLPVLFGTLTLRWLVADVGWQHSEFDKYGASSRTGVSSGELADVASHWSSYLLGQRDDIDIMVTIGGQEEHLFNSREIKHMVDVRISSRGSSRSRLLAGGYALVYLVASRAWWAKTTGGLWEQAEMGRRYHGVIIWRSRGAVHGGFQRLLDEHPPGLLR